jgi:hypothetical protein
MPVTSAQNMDTIYLWKMSADFDFQCYYTMFSRRQNSAKPLLGEPQIINKTNVIGEVNY